MNKYYQDELENLRVLAAEFSEAYPSLAPQLASSSSDPDVERVLEGVAFLTGKIRQKIDDDFPEFAQGLLKQIFPHYLRPLPSASIVEFTAKSILKNKLMIPAGTHLDSTEVEGISCRFSTTYDVDVWPITINTINQSETQTGRKSIEINFQLNSINLALWDADSLRLHLSGEYHSAVDLYFILMNCLDCIELSTADGADAFIANDIILSPLGFEPENALLEYPSNSFPSYRLIQEYFLLKEKFLFIELSNIRKYTQKLSGNNFTLKFYLHETPVKIPRLTSSSFILNASPIINTFKHEAESILNDFKRSEYRVRPLRNAGDQYQVYSVNSVVGQNRRTAEKNSYYEIGVSDPEKNTRPVYNINYKQTDINNNAGVFVSFSYPPDYNIDSHETMLVQLTCTNGNNPAKLKPGDISKPTSSTSELIEFKNLLQPSDSQNLPSESSMLWRLLSHLSLNYLSLADTENFKALLGLYIFSGSTGNKQEIANRRRIDGVDSITVSACDRLVGGVPIRGQAINVNVKSENYAGLGDMYLFGMLLDYLFGSFSSLNCFTEFSMTDIATDKVYTWPVRLGDRPLI